MVQEARIRKTRLFLNERETFLAQLHADIELLAKQAARRGLLPAIRLNGTTDIRWENYGIIQAFPDIQFYDYTKFPRASRRELPANYRLVYSLNESEHSKSWAEDWQSAGVNTAVVFHGELPATFYGRPVIDGDLSDLRFLDAPGVIVGLKAKGKARGASSGFVR